MDIPTAWRVLVPCCVPCFPAQITFSAAFVARSVQTPLWRLGCCKSWPGQGPGFISWMKANIAFCCPKYIHIWLLFRIEKGETWWDGYFEGAEISSEAQHLFGRFGMATAMNWEPFSHHFQLQNGSGSSRLPVTGDVWRSSSTKDVQRQTEQTQRRVQILIGMTPSEW